MAERPLSPTEARILRAVTPPRPASTPKEGTPVPRTARKTPQTRTPNQATGKPAQTAPQGTGKGRVTRKAAPARKTAPNKPQRGVRVAVDDPGEGIGYHHGTAGVVPPKMVVEDATQHPHPTPCRVCGGQVDPAGRHDTWGPWRQHQTCSTVAASPPARLAAATAALGHGDLTLTDAALVEHYVPSYADTFDGWNPPGMKNRQTRPTIYPPKTKVRDKMPWRHVDRRALTKAVGQLPRLRRQAGLDPSACATGPCAICGVVEATGWTETELTWPDGGPAPVCGRCWPVLVRHGEPTYAEDLRPVAAEAITGVAPNMGEPVPDRLLPFLTSGVTATGEPWAHLNPEAVTAYRWARWTAYPDLAPPEHQTEAHQRATAARTERLAVTTAREQQQAEQANVFGF